MEIKAEEQTLATITLQNYFRLYDEAFGDDRNSRDRGRGVRLDLQARRRSDPHEQADDSRGQGRLCVPVTKSKLKAIVEDIKERYEVGQPVLVGTTKRGKVRGAVEASA